MIDGDEGRILDLAAGPAPVHLGEHPASPAEQDQALVHEVRPEIAMRAPGLLGGLAPLVADDAPSLEPRLEAVDLAEGARREQRPHRQEVAVPAPVLVDGQDPPGAFGGLEQRLGFRDVHRDRLVDDDVPPGLERADPDRDVGPVRGHDHDHLDVAGVEELVDGRDDRRSGVLGGRLRLPLRVRGGDGGQPQPVDRVDVRRMEQAAGQPVADHADADRARRRHRSRP